IFDVPVVDSAPDWDGIWGMSSYNHSLTTDTTPYVAMSANGDTFVVGGNNHNGNQGQIRIHQLVNDSWTSQQYINGFSVGSSFGFSVDISENGDVIAVGAYDQGNTGYVYIFRHDGTFWVLDQAFRNSNYATDDFYGYAVSLSDNGHRLAVSATREGGETNSISGQGAVFIHDYDGSYWSETQVLRASDAEVEDRYGRLVALSATGDQLAVTTLNGESAYFYDLSSSEPSDWQGTEQIYVSPASDTDEFGTYGLALSSNAIAVGAYVDDNAFSGHVSNTEIDDDFNENDTTSNGTFDKEDNSISNSGAAYLISFDAHVLNSLTSVQVRIDV
ncbi:hypothetical protein, partial [Aliivibrio finisterrensis]|uniref:hypothetical protein n=1 Tax=Aliivibrio finisterrensis TaxID=511998 RepID=UPI001AD6CE9D